MERGTFLIVSVLLSTGMDFTPEFICWKALEALNPGIESDSDDTAEERLLEVVILGGSLNV